MIVHRPHPSRRARGIRRGMSLIEAMISLVIASILLTAVGVAFNASASGITANDQFFRATQGARIGLNQILAQLRQVEQMQVAPSGQSVSFFRAHPATGIDERCTYRFFPEEGELRLVYDSREGQPSVRVIRNVADVRFHQDTEDINRDGVQFVVRLSVSIRVRVGKTEVPLSGTAVPRRNLRHH